MMGNCNKSLTDNARGLLDLDVTYTGCEITCQGVTVKPGMSIRNILDLLLSNCGGTTPINSQTNFWFSVAAPIITTGVKSGDYALQGSGKVWQFNNNSWVDTGITIGSGGGGGLSDWGDIQGNIINQTDLISYISEQISESFSTLVNEEIPQALESSAGQSMTYNNVTNKIDLGTSPIPTLRAMLFPETDSVIILGTEGDGGIPDFDKALLKLQGNVVELTPKGDGTGLKLTDIEFSLYGEGTSVYCLGGSLYMQSAGVTTVSSATSIEFLSPIINVGQNNQNYTTNIKNGKVNIGIGSGFGYNIELTPDLIKLNYAVTSKRDITFDQGYSVILRSANGTKYRISVSDAGALSTVVVP